MSKERELLKRFMTELNTEEDVVSLFNDIKECLAQPEQEPVAWCQMVEGKVQDLLTSFEMKDWIYDKSWMPLYTAPPKREPLSFEDLNIMWCGNPIDFARRIESIHGIGGGNE